MAVGTWYTEHMEDFLTQPIPETIVEMVERVLSDIPIYPPVSGIYAITNEVTKQLYIGSSKNIYSRLTTHIKMLHAKKHHSYKLQQVFNVHGLSAFSFTIVEEVDDYSMLFDREQHYLDLHSKKRSKLLNVSKRADGSDYLRRKTRRTTKRKNNVKRKTKNTQ